MPGEAKLPSLRVHLSEFEPQFSLPRKFGLDLILRTSDSFPFSPPVAEHSPTFAKSRIVLDAFGAEAHDRAANFIAALRVGSDCSVQTLTYEYLSGQFFTHPEGEAEWIWGHFSQILSEKSAVFINTHMNTFSRYCYPEEYSRTGNALRLFESAAVTSSPDLALLGFVGTIESLFSVATQELSFRLSLSLSKFLADDRVTQMDLFKKAKELYKVRSAIAHGDKIDSSAETAAIVMNEHWTPRAADFARESLRRVFDLGLTDIFDARAKHEALMNALPFCDRLSELVKGASDSLRLPD